MLACLVAAAPALSGSLTLRPLTPTEVSKYGLTGSNAQFSAGCQNVALGEPVYIDAMVNAAIASVIAPWTEAPLSCTCQPTNGVPSYSMVSL